MTISDMSPEHLRLYCSILESMTLPWMLDKAQELLEEAINPDTKLNRLSAKTEKTWRKYCYLFDSNQFKEAAVVYADYLELRSIFQHERTRTHSRGAPATA